MVGIAVILDSAPWRAVDDTVLWSEKRVVGRWIRRAAALIILVITVCGLLCACGADGGVSSGNGSGTGGGIGTGDGGTDPDAVAVYILGDGDGIVYRGETVELSDGRVCRSGELKPVWAEIAEATGLVLCEAERLEDADVIVGSVNELSVLAGEGAPVDLSHLYASLPNLRGYTWENSDARLAFVSGEYGETYVSPLPDYAKSPTRLPYIRRDVVERLLDGEGDFTLPGTDELVSAEASPFVSATENYEVKIIAESHFGTKSITKNVMKAGNIVEILNFAIEIGGLSGESAVNILRDYIDEAYGGFYGNERSKLFIGESAAWDADELVALLRCISACASALGIDGGGFCTVDQGADAVRLASLLYGVRGLDSSDTMLYADGDGELKDAKANLDVYKAIARIRDLSREGLISEDGGVIYYLTASDACGLEGDFVPMVPPVLSFSLGEEEIFCRYSESYYSFDGVSIAISARISDESDDVRRAAALVDFLYTEDGSRLVRCGTSNSELYDYTADAHLLTGGDVTSLLKEYLGVGIVFGISDEVFCEQIEGYKTTLDAIRLLHLQGNILTPTTMPDVEYVSIPISPTLTFTDGEAALMEEHCPALRLMGDMYGDNLRRYIYRRVMEEAGSSIPVPTFEGADVYIDVMENLWERYKKFYRVIFE